MSKIADRKLSRDNVAHAHDDWGKKAVWENRL